MDSATPQFDFISSVRRVKLASIRPSDENPRGPVNRDASFERLTSSINKVGILVPLVVSELANPADGHKYQLVDGERRFWAARELGKDTVPVHVLQKHLTKNELRQLMFHLHMTREQWGALAQCRALAESYPDLHRGLKLDQKSEWVHRLVEETNMPPVTARDRVRVLAWPEKLKSEVFDFDADTPNIDIYSYVLAIEASIIEPSYKSFGRDFYNHGKPLDQAINYTRGQLLHKLLRGVRTGQISSREQIRNVSPLFDRSLEGKQKKSP